MTPLNVLLHAPTPDAFGRAQANARNLLNLEPDARVEMVVNGPAVPVALELGEPALRPLLRLCENSPMQQQLSAPADLQRVSAAVAHLACRQLARLGLYPLLSDVSCGAFSMPSPPS